MSDPAEEEMAMLAALDSVPAFRPYTHKTAEHIVRYSYALFGKGHLYNAQWTFDVLIQSINHFRLYWKNDVLPAVKEASVKTRRVVTTEMQEKLFYILWAVRGEPDRWRKTVVEAARADPDFSWDELLARENARMRHYHCAVWAMCWWRDAPEEGAETADYEPPEATNFLVEVTSHLHQHAEAESTPPDGPPSGPPGGPPGGPPSGPPDPDRRED